MRRYIVALALLVPIAAVAHEASQHKGKPTEGEVVSVEGDRLSISTADGPVVVTLTEATKLEQGDQPTGRDAVKRGVHLSVFGTKLPSGELVAREVIVHPAGGGRPGSSDSGGHHPPASPVEKPMR